MTEKNKFAGYYVHIEPEASFVYCPQKEILSDIRHTITEDSSEIQSILKNPEFSTVFPELYENKIKTAPRGFNKNHPDISLIRFKSYTVIKSVSKKEFL